MSKRRNRLIHTYIDWHDALGIGTGHSSPLSMSLLTPDEKMGPFCRLQGLVELNGLRPANIVIILAVREGKEADLLYWILVQVPYIIKIVPDGRTIFELHTPFRLTIHPRIGILECAALTGDMDAYPGYCPGNALWKAYGEHKR